MVSPKIKGLLILLLAPVALIASGPGNQTDSWYIPEAGFVPDSLTAIAVAKAIWEPIYGNQIERCEPYVSTLEGDTVWYVRGTLESSADDVIVIGGVPEARIRKSDCTVLGVIHGQ